MPLSGGIGVPFLYCVWTSFVTVEYIMNLVHLKIKPKRHFVHLSAQITGCRELSHALHILQLKFYHCCTLKNRLLSQNKCITIAKKYFALLAYKNSWPAMRFSSLETPEAIWVMSVTAPASNLHASWMLRNISLQTPFTAASVKVGGTEEDDRFIRSMRVPFFWGS